MRRVPTAYSAPGELTSPRWAVAFAAGCGGNVEGADYLHSGPVAMFGSPQRWDLLTKAQRDRRDWYYGDHGYFARGFFYRTTRNAYQHEGVEGDADAARLDWLGVEVRPWRTTGGHVLVCPPGDVFAGLMGFDAIGWLRSTMEVLQGHTDREIRVRRKKTTKRPLAGDLVDCWALVTHMSNTAVEAVLAGVPVFCTGPCAGLTMGLTELEKIEAPRRPGGRREWAARLANNQWTLDEMKKGALWRAIGRSGQ